MEIAKRWYLSHMNLSSKTPQHLCWGSCLTDSAEVSLEFGSSVVSKRNLFEMTPRLKYVEEDKVPLTEERGHDEPRRNDSC